MRVRGQRWSSLLAVLALVSAGSALSLGGVGGAEAGALRAALSGAPTGLAFGETTLGTSVSDYGNAPFYGSDAGQGLGPVVGDMATDDGRYFSNR